MPEASALLRLKQHGQSVWLDHVERRLLTNGVLRRIIADDGLSGLTSNPSVFGRAIMQTDEYSRAIAEMFRRRAGAEEIYEHLAIYDIKKAADAFRDEFERSDGDDGYVSFKVSPRMAFDATATVAEALRLQRLIERPNVMIEVPATRPGITAIRQLTREGINVNATLLFSVGRYVEVINAYMWGLEDRLRDGGAVDGIASVASFPINRIDISVDAALDRIAYQSTPAVARRTRELKGRGAVANAALAYRRFDEHFSSARWMELARRGARRQRLLWTSTGTRNSTYHDVKYVEALIAPQTVTTLPLSTLTAYRDHGAPQPRLVDAAGRASDVIEELFDIGVDMVGIVNTLEIEGVEKFTRSHTRLLGSIDTMREQRIARAG
jgi:transaldolase